MTRAVVIGLAETGIAVCRRLRAEGADVTILEDMPASGERYPVKLVDGRFIRESERARAHKTGK